MVYSYHVSHPSELRYEIRKNFENFLEGKEDESVTTDDRPFEQQAASLLDELALFEQQMQPSVKPEPAPETELE